MRELQHAVERAVILSAEPMLPATAFAIAPGPAIAPANGTATGRGPGHLRLASTSGSHSFELPSLKVADAERVLIQRALVASGQNRTRAAELLGISVRTLRNKLNVRAETADVLDNGSDDGEVA